MVTFKKRLLVLLLVLGVALAGCQMITSSEVVPDGVPEATFIGKEYAYEGPDSIAGGWTRVTFDNQGELPHDLMLMRLADGKTIDDVTAMLESEAAPPSWIEMVGGASAEPGTSNSFVSELKPGNYVMLSFGGGEEGPPDAAQGMVAGLTVTEATATVDEAALPAADATISLVDYQFVVDGLQAGEHTVKVSNDGTELHEAIMFRLKEGKTMADFQAFMESAGEGPPEGEPPMEEAGGVFLSPGNTTYMTLDLEPGNYILLCFLPSEKNDMTPHFMMGMVTEVAVN